jgi:peptidoglycan/xylan/chitin deacetylase (PgdA/CDA1 family)
MRAPAHRLEAQTGGRPPGFVHVDLDGLWTLAGCYGYPEGVSFTQDPVFDQGLPRLLGLLDELSIKATFFIVGRDLEHPAKATLIGDLVRRGHEPAVHGWSHGFGLESLDDAGLEGEIGRTARAIESACGQRPLGFRAPGYAAGPRTLAAVSRAGLRYDGSMLPTRFGWLLRAMARRLRARSRPASTLSTLSTLSTSSTLSSSLRTRARSRRAMARRSQPKRVGSIEPS